MANIDEGKLYVPIMLKNASAVSGVRFYISEPTGKEDYLSLDTFDHDYQHGTSYRLGILCL